MLELITQYSDNPINKRSMKDADVSRHEWNAICGDDIMVYMKIQDSKFKIQNWDMDDNPESWILNLEYIKDWSYDGNTSMITTAASSFLSELIVWKTLEECLTMTYENTLLPEWFEVTPRRKRAGAIAILATRNGIHEYLWDGITDEWDDVVEM